MSEKRTNLLASIIASLNEKYDYAVLRNFENLPDDMDSRDVDILLNPEQLPAFRCDCRDIAIKHQFKIVYTFWDTQLWTIVFGSIDDTVVNLLQIDVLVNLNVLGVIFLETKQTLSKRKFNGRLYHLPKVETFLAKFIYCRVLGANYPSKYEELFNEIKQTFSDETNKLLCEILNDSNCNLEYWLSKNNKDILYKGFISSLRRHPVKQIKTIYIFTIQYIKNIVFQRGLFISISGPDGSGKTTIINKLSDQLSLINPPLVYHYRPKILPNISELGIKFKLIKESDKRYHIPHRSNKKSKVQSFIRLFYYLFDYIFGYYIRLMPLRWRKHIIIYDRYFADLVSDSERASIFINYRQISRFSKFVPEPDYNFIIKSDICSIQKRKQELTPEEIDRIYKRLDLIYSKKLNYFFINNDKSSDDASCNILKIIFDHQNIKNMNKPYNLVIKNT